MNNNQSILNALSHIGITSDQGLVYLACLKGSHSASQIAIQARMNRTVVYRHLEELCQRGLIQPSIKQKKRQYIAQPPDILSAIVRQHLTEIEGILPTLLSFFTQNSSDEPLLRFYKDVAGIKKVMEEVLQCSSKFYRVIGAFYDKQLRSMISLDYLRDWGERRIARGVSHQGLRPEQVPDDRHELGPLFMANGKEVLREYRLLPLPPDLPLIIFLCDEKVYFVGAQKGHAYAAVLESQDVFVVLNSIFDLLWISAKTPRST